MFTRTTYVTHITSLILVSFTHIQLKQAIQMSTEIKVPSMSCIVLLAFLILNYIYT